MEGMPPSGSDQSKHPVFKSAAGDDLSELYDTRKLYLGIQRHLILICLLALLCAGVGGAITFYALTHYKADAVVLYKEDLPKELPGGIVLNNPTLTTAVDLITLDANLQAVIGQLGLALSYRDLEKMISVPRPVNLSHLIHIIAKSDNPNIAIDIANALAKIAVKRSQDFYSQQIQSELNNFKNQLGETNQRLTKELKEIEDFKKEHQYFEMTADYLTLMQQLSDSRSKLQSANIRFNSLYVEFENLKRAAATIPEQYETKGVPAAQKSKDSRSLNLEAIERSLSEARAKYAQDNPKIKILEDQLKEYQNTNKPVNEPQEQASSSYERNLTKEQLNLELIRMESKVRSAQKVKEDLAASLARLEKQLDTLPADQMKFAKLLKAKQTSEERVDFLNKAIKTFQLMLNVPSGSLELYQLAEKAKPISDAWYVLGLPLIGLIFGIFLGVLSAVYMEMRDDKFRTLRQIEMSLHIPSLMLMPEFSFFTKRNSKDKTLYFIRTLSERLERIAPKDAKALSVSFTSSIRREGKSCLAYHLASYYHRLGKKTILIEMDASYNPFTEEIPFVSLENYLEGKADLKDIIFHETMDRIKVGKNGPYMKELVKSAQMNELMNRLKNEYDVVVMDTPGVIETDYTINLVDMTDLHVFVIGSSIANIKTVHESLRDLYHAGVKPTGIILNRVAPVYVEDTRIKLETQRSRRHLWEAIFGKS